MKFTVIILVLVISSPVRAQVKHNFEMEPSNTNCHELPQKFNSPEQAIEAVEKATYRVKQSIKISRYQSPHAAAFYSCDGKTGFMVVDVTDSTRKIYKNIPQEVWDQFIDTNDPIGYYNIHIENKYENIE